MRRNVEGFIQSGKMVGRPTKYTEKLADDICVEISTTAKGVSKICKEFDIHYATVKRWLVDNEDFRAKYARAKEEQAEHLAEELLEIADTALIGKKTKETKDGVFEEVGDNVERSKLMVDARKWIASKLLPKKYGDRLNVTGIDPITAIRIIRDNGSNSNPSTATP